MWAYVITTYVLLEKTMTKPFDSCYWRGDPGLIPDPVPFPPSVRLLSALKIRLAL